MTALVDLQRQMASAIRGNSGEAPIGVFRPEHLPSGEPLSVYRNNHRISLGAALTATFRTVSLLIGEDAFNVLAWRFLQSLPPVNPVVSEYGAALASYLDTEPLVKDLPYLADIARLDWAINVASIAVDTATLDSDAVATMPPNQLAELSLYPLLSLTLIQSRFPLPKIYEAARCEQDEGEIDLNSGESCMMISRQHGSIKIANIPADVFYALGRLTNGESLLNACEALTQTSLADFLGKYVLTGGFQERK